MLTSIKHIDGLFLMHLLGPVKDYLPNDKKSINNRFDNYLAKKQSSEYHLDFTAFRVIKSSIFLAISASVLTLAF